MNWWPSILAVSLLVTGRAAAPARADDGSPVCVVIRIREEITLNTVYLIRRGLHEAAEKKAAAILLDLDTNGGRMDATEEIISLLLHAPAKTFTFVNSKAYSAGAFIAAATDRIYMAPGSVIGAATPVVILPGQGVQELSRSYEEKINSAMRALIRATAREKGHDPDVFEAMVDADKEVVRDGQVVSPKGKLLTLTNEEAARSYGKPPRPLLSAGTVPDQAAVLDRAGWPGAATVEIEPFGFEVLARWITAISPLLIVLGFVALYIELQHPGVALPALVAALCFGLYFLGYYAAGLAGWEVVVLFVVGFALLALEIFVIPGFGVTGLLGIGAILVALVLAMVERWPGGPILPSWTELRLPLLKVGLSLAGSGAIMVVLARFLPETRLFKKFTLTATTSAADGYTTSAGDAQSLLETVGIAETMLRPSGKGRFGDRLVDVVTEGDLIEKGVSIKIVRVEGSRVVVTRAG